MSGCATEVVRQRPGVEEAKSCLRHINKSPAEHPDYIIRTCTNNGIWLVDRIDKTSGMVISTYDFVNGDYTGAETGGAPISIEALGGGQESEFIALQKTLNKALLQ
jgi:hypothetical protein